MKAASRFNNNLRYRDPLDSRQHQLTPHYVLRLIAEDLGGFIGLDPCTESDNPTNARQFYAPPKDGLSLSWNFKSVFVNPPYGKAREPWIERCIETAKTGRMVALLVPAATDTRIWQRAAICATAVVFTKGRLKFGVLRENRRQAAASHPSSIIGWNTDLDACTSLGMRLVIR